MAAPYYYYGMKEFAAQVYEELKDADYETYKNVRQKYRMAFVNSRPHSSATNAAGYSLFPSEWNRTLKNLKAMYGYKPPKQGEFSKFLHGKDRVYKEEK